MVVLGIAIVGHRFSPQSLGEEHTEALERAHWTAIRKLKRRVELHPASTGAETEQSRTGLFKRLVESATAPEKDLKLRRDILDRSECSGLIMQT